MAARSWGEGKIWRKRHGTAHNIAADQIGVARFEIGGSQRMARQNARAEAGGEALDLLLDGVASYRAVEPLGTWQ